MKHYKLIIRQIREPKKEDELITKAIEYNKIMKCLKPKLGQRQIISLMFIPENNSWKKT